MFVNFCVPVYSEIREALAILLQGGRDENYKTFYHCYLIIPDKM